MPIASLLKAAIWPDPQHNQLSDCSSAAKIKARAARPSACRAVKVPPVKRVPLALLQRAVSPDKRTLHGASSPFRGPRTLQRGRVGSLPTPWTPLWNVNEKPAAKAGWGSSPAAPGTPGPFLLYIWGL